MKFLRSGTFYWTLLMTAVVVAMLLDARALPTNLRETPLLLGSTTLILFALLIAGEFHPPLIGWLDSTLEDLWGGKRQVNAPMDEAPPVFAPWPPVLRIIGYIAGFWLAVFLFGLFVVPPLFIVVFLAVEARVRLGTAIAAALIVCTVITVGLTLLHVDLWPGVIPEVVPGYLGGAVMPDF